jgi:hypothetical protein
MLFLLLFFIFGALGMELFGNICEYYQNLDFVMSVLIVVFFYIAPPPPPLSPNSRHENVGKNTTKFLLKLELG